ncbi:MAG: DsrE/DsrF/DrsH-like family protein, partial [Candidatus Bathyarchaeia archaeon]
RSRLVEIPKNRRIVLYCRVGLRGYLATRILRQAGYDAYNLSGGWLTYLLHYPQKGQFPLPPIDGTLNSKYPSSSVSPCVSSTCTHNENNSQKGGVKQQEVSFSVNRELDVSSLQCPGPIVRLKETMESLKAGDVLCLTASCSFSHDLEAWIRSTGHKLLTTQTHNGLLKAWIQKSTSPVFQQDSYPLSQPSEAAIVLFSGDLDRALAALIIATGLASLGTHVSIFFTFWGLNVLRKAQPPKVKKDWLSKMFGWMMPCGAKKLALSKMHMAGLGTALMKYVMQKKNVLSLEDLIKEAKKLGVKFIACEMAMNVMGLKKEELIDEIEEIAGVPAFAELARRGHPTLFI